jgi:hypothetical protein
MILTAMLALYQVIYMIGAYFIFAIEIHHHKATIEYIVLNDIFVGTAYALFNVAHFELAWIYRGIAKTTPLILSDEKMPQEEAKKDRRMHDWIFYANIVAPAVFVINDAIQSILSQKSTNETMIYWFKTFVTVFYFLNLACEIHSGWMLLDGLRGIRTYFVDQEAKEHLDTKKMWLHMWAFALYLVAGA